LHHANPSCAENPLDCRVDLGAQHVCLVAEARANSSYKLASLSAKSSPASSTAAVPV